MKISHIIYKVPDTDSDFQGIYFPHLKSQRVGLIRRVDSESGTGEMKCFDVAPGIQVSYNDLNMDSCFQPVKLRHDFLVVEQARIICYYY